MSTTESNHNEPDWDGIAYVSIVMLILLIMALAGCSPKMDYVKVVYNDLEVDTLELESKKYLFIREEGEYKLIYKNQLEADGIIYFEGLR